MSWSDERVAVLSKLWLEGVSASQIAMQLGGVTRNAVIGKVHRLGLSGRSAPSAPSRAARAVSPRPAVRPLRSIIQSTVPETRPSPAAPVVLDGRGLIVELVHLGAHACKWPIGDPKGPTFSFCGQHAEGRYCAVHEDRGVRRGTWRPDGDLVIKRALADLI